MKWSSGLVQSTTGLDLGCDNLSLESNLGFIVEEVVNPFREGIPSSAKFP